MTCTKLSVLKDEIAHKEWVVGIFLFFKEVKKRKKHLREWRSAHMYTKLRAFREETEEIELVTSLATTNSSYWIPVRCLTSSAGFTCC